MDTIVDSLQLHYEHDGQGTALVLIHGLGGNLHDWDKFIPDLSRHHRVLRWDVRGFGASGKPPGPYSPQLFARDLAGLIRTLGITKTHVAGISMGGVIAQRFTLDYPEFVSSLTLMSTSSEVGEAAQKAWGKTADIIEQRGFSSSTEFAQRVFAPSFVKNAPHEVQAMVERTATNDPRAYAAAARAIGSYNWTAELGRIQVPTLILQGREDLLTPPGGSVKLSRGIPRSRLLMIADCGHVIPVEKPALLQQTLLAFLAGVDFSRA